MQQSVRFFLPLILILLLMQSAYAQGQTMMRVNEAEKMDISEPLSSIQPAALTGTGLAPEDLARQMPNFRVPPVDGLEAEYESDPLIQDWDGVAGAMPPTIANFDGVSNIDGVHPPDTQGDVGLTHYMQWVNVSFAIYEKDGTLAYGPAGGNTLWTGFGGICETNNDGDPIVLYDRLAGRWMVNQFALQYGGAGFYQCIAVSTGEDPTGSWYRYAFFYDSTMMNDYPKFGVWPDAYYMSINQFDASDSYSWAGVGVCAYEREKMLAGQGARQICYDIGAVTTNYGSLLPADLDGPRVPTGLPNYFIGMTDTSRGWPSDSIMVWEFDVDWDTPANSTFGLSGHPNYAIATAAFDSDLCGYSAACIPQPGGHTLDAISSRPMYRLQYRRFTDYDTMVFNQSVDVGSDHAGVRWYEMRDSGSGWGIHQQGTYAPDADHRWMGSAAMDASGNIAIGYSLSSASTYPSIAYAGRLAGDPAGTLPQSEAIIVSGSGSQTSEHHRWGDYSMLAVDPEDDCTFWYTNEYIETTGYAPWKTKIASFRFPTCDAGDRGDLEGRVYRSGGSSGIEGAQVDVEGIYTLTDSNGDYLLMDLPVGDYDVTYSAYGYQEETVSGVSIADDIITTQDVYLLPLSTTTVSGTVTDTQHGWPLYARIDISSGSFSDTVYTDPLTGTYSIDLYQGTDYEFEVEAVASGYDTLTDTVSPDADPYTADFVLSPNSFCEAPGYAIDPIHLEDFESDNGTYTITGTNATWIWGQVYNGPGEAHSGSKAWGTSMLGNYVNEEDSQLSSPYIDLSSHTGQTLSLFWWQYVRTETSNDFARVEISKDGGVSWTEIAEFSGAVNSEWTQYRYELDQSYNVFNFRVRFSLESNGSNTDVGFYIDDVTVASENCLKIEGGLVVGNVSDENTSSGLVGANVEEPSGIVATTIATPNDPNEADGFYTIFVPAPDTEASASDRDLIASFELYANSTETVNIVNDDTVRQDFNLPAGKLSVDPDEFDVTVWSNIDGLTSVEMNLINEGGADADFTLQKVNDVYAVSSPTGPFAKAVRHGSPKWRNAVSLADTRWDATIPPSPTIVGGLGVVLNSWATALTISWGAGFDLDNNQVWIGDPGLISTNSDDKDHSFSVVGVADSQIDISDWVGAWAADMAYHNWTEKLWQIDVGGDNCIHELDPAGLAATGKTICPAWGISQRGLAYDPVGDTFYAGGWNDATIHHFTLDGTILDSVDVSLPISGLAYNPGTKHLFVMVNIDSGNDLYVLDADDDYNVLGSVDVVGMDANSGAGLAIDCDGNLWAINQNTNEALLIDSDEDFAPTGGDCTNLFDISWLTTTPPGGTVDASSTEIIGLDFSSTGLAVGTYQAHLRIQNDTPYGVLRVPLTMEVVMGYIITSTSGSNGSIDPEGENRILEGDDQSFAFTPDTHYHVDVVVVDGIDQGASDSYDFENVTANHSLHVGFAIDTYDITATAGSNGGIDPDGTTTVNALGSQTYTMTPDLGFMVEDVKVDSTSVGAVSSYTFSDVLANHTISATFETATFTISATAGEGGDITPAGDVTVAYDADQQFSIDPDTGYEIDDVLVDGVSQGSRQSYTFENVTEDHEIEALFEIITYRVSASAGDGGSISPEGNNNVDHGDDITFTITPDTGYHIDDVLVDGNSAGTDDSYTFEDLDDDHSIEVSFALDEFKITATAGEGGTVDPSGDSMVEYGDSLAVSIVPDTGYHVADVKIDDVSFGPMTSYTFTDVIGEHSLEAIFAIDTFEIIPSAAAGGSIAPATTQIVDYGDDSTFTFSHDTGWHIADVLIDGASIGAVASHTFENVTASHTVHVSFAIDMFDISVAAGEGGRITPGNDLSLPYGATQSFSILPDTGYHILDVLVDGHSAGAVESYEFKDIADDHSIEAVFALDTFVVLSASTEGGSIEPEGEATLEYGSSATYTVEAETGYHIEDILVDGVSMGPLQSYTFPFIDTDHGIQAVFAIDTFVIDARSGFGGFIDPEGIIGVEYGADQAFEFHPSEGYHVSDVQVDGASLGALEEYEFTEISSDHMLTVLFALDTFTISTAASQGGSINPAGPMIVNYGSSISLDIVPDAGHHIVDVRLDGASLGTVATVELSEIDSDHGIEADFAIDTFTVISGVVDGDGGIIDPLGDNTVNFGDSIAFEILPREGYHITDVIVDDVSFGPLDRYEFSFITDNHRIMAAFAIDSFTITPSAGEGGSIDPAEEIEIVFGDSRTFSIIADEGWHVADVLVDGSSVGDVTEYTFGRVSENHVIAAFFAIDRYDIGASAGEGGTIEPAGIISIEHGSDQTFVISPNDGFTIEDVVVDGASQGALTEYTFEAISEAHEIEALFAEIEVPEDGDGEEQEVDTDEIADGDAIPDGDLPDGDETTDGDQVSDDDSDGDNCSTSQPGSPSAAWIFAILTLATISSFRRRRYRG